MTEVSVVSDLLNSGATPSPPAPAPTSFQPIGMPITPPAFNEAAAVQARAEIDALKSDKEWYAALKAEGERGVSGPARQRWDALHKAAYPAPTAIASQADVDSQAAARAEQQWSGYFAALRSRFPLTPENEAELRAGVIRADLHEWAKEEKARLVKDRGFGRRVLDGDREANRQWGMITSMLSLRPVK